MLLGMDLGLGPGDILLDGDPAAPLPKKGATFRPMSCGQTAGWINMPVGTEIGLAQTALCYMGTQVPQKGV